MNTKAELLALADRLVKDWSAAGRMPEMAWDFRGFAVEGMTRALAQRASAGDGVLAALPNKRVVPGPADDGYDALQYEGAWHWNNCIEAMRANIRALAAAPEGGGEAERMCTALRGIKGAVQFFDGIEDDAAQPSAEQGAVPIPMILHCPRCHLQHVDEPDERTEGWKNPPHRSHLCHGCGCIWRPADVATNGVRSIKTQGKADTAAPAAVIQCGHLWSVPKKDGTQECAFCPAIQSTAGTAMSQEEEAARDDFCDGNCTWTNHHPDCPRAEQTPAAGGDGKLPNHDEPCNDVCGAGCPNKDSP